MQNSDLDALKKLPGCVRIFGERVRLRKEGKELVGLCPFHAEKSGSFHIREDADGTWLGNCFGCAWSGNVMQFVRDFDKIQMRDAIALVEKALGGQTWENAKTSVEATFRPVADSKKTYKVLTSEQYAPFETALESSQAAKAFLARRGISLDTAKRLRIGFRQDVTKITAPDRFPDIKAAGWLAMPRFEGDTVVGVHYRTVVDGRKEFCRQPGMATALFNTPAIDIFEPLYVVEGELDSLSLEQAGFRSVSIPSGSTEVTPTMRDQMMQAKEVILAGDCDGGVGVKAMDTLWRQLQERTYLLKWPDGMKDANQTFLEECKGDVSIFRTMVEELTSAAKLQPMPDIYSLQEAMSSANRTSLKDHPERLHFPWPSVDNMAIILPGGILSLFATQTGTGKSSFTLEATIHGARKHGEIVLNYQCEMAPDEVSAMVAANLLRRSRNDLNPADLKQASRLIQNIRYYIGFNPTLSTPTEVLDLIEAGIRRLGATTVVLDHIHFICRGQNEIQEQAAAMQRMKRMAGQYRCKFIVVGQPRKADQKSKGRVVGITDLKGSESVASDADAVIALHRDVLKDIDPANPPKDNLDPKVQVHLLKARSKGEGSAMATLMLCGDFCSFQEVDFSYEVPRQ